MSLARGAMAKHEGAVAAALLALLSAALALPSIRGVDGAGNYVYLMSIVSGGDLDFSDDYARIDQSRTANYRMSDEPRDPATGRPGNRFGIGAALFWAPAVAVVHGALAVFAPEMASGWGRPYEWAVAVASAWWGCLGVWFLFMRMREEFGSAPAWTASAGILFASALGFYVWAHGSMSHAVSFFIAVMAMLAFERTIASGSLLSALTLGMWAGLLVITRFQDASWTLALGAGLVILGGHAEHENEPAAGAPSPPPSPLFWKAAAAGIYSFGVLLALLPQMAVWRELYGSWLAGPRPYFGQGAGELNLWPRNLFQVIASEKGGAFAWHPILIAGAAGLALRRGGGAASVRAAGLIGIALQLYLVACWSVWWAGASFGNRFFISSYPYFAWGAARLVCAMRPRVSMRWIAAALAALVVWNAGLLIQYGTEMIPREEAAGWARVISNQFSAVPQWIADRLF